jgi:hypothetical protein
MAASVETAGSIPRRIVSGNEDELCAVSGATLGDSVDMPPETSMRWALTQRLSSDSSEAIIGPMSSGWPTQERRGVVEAQEAAEEAHGFERQSEENSKRGLPGV